jgi:hypothetical protein
MPAAANKQSRRGRAIRIPSLAALAAILAAAFLAAPANAEVVYDNAPGTPAAAAASLGFEASETSELGALLQLAGAARANPRIGVAMSVWACEHGEWGSGCTTTPGAGFSVPITLSVYAVGSGGAPGALLARQTQAFQLAYRPSTECSVEGTETGFTAGDGSCQNGLLEPIEFELQGLTLPSEAIVSVAFDTKSSGYAPTHEGSPADALNVVLTGPPTVGANPREGEEGVYLATGPEAGDDAFRFRPQPGWQRQPAFTIDAAAAPAPSAPTPVATPSAASPRATRTAPLALKRKMTVTFPRKTAKLAGPGALVEVRCTGSSAARCIGTLALQVAGTVHKMPYSISKGRKQFVVVPLGDDLELIDSLRSPTATVTASTVQVSGAAVKTKRTLKLK